MTVNEIVVKHYDQPLFSAYVAIHFTRGCFAYIWTGCEFESRPLLKRSLMTEAHHVRAMILQERIVLVGALCTYSGKSNKRDVHYISSRTIIFAVIR